MKQFKIGFRDGRLLVKNQLDRERQEKHVLKVKVLDLSRKNVSATTTVEILVEDVNDSSPEFEQDLYEYVASENTPIGTLVGKVTAVDPDIAPKNNQVLYQLINGKKSVLNIDQQTGNIHLFNTLDFEKEPFLEWTVVARDSNALTGESVIQLKVLDENDNPPQFLDQSPLRLNIQATDKLDRPRFLYKFKVKDVDTVSSLKSGDSFFYSVDDGDVTLFKIDQQHGVLEQIRPFNAIELATFAEGKDVEKELNISVTDGLFTSQLQVAIVFQATATQIAPLQFNSLINTISLNENL